MLPRRKPKRLRSEVSFLHDNNTPSIAAVEGESYPPRKAPTGLRAGRGEATVASAKRRVLFVKLRVAVERMGVAAAKRLRAPEEAILADILGRVCGCGCLLGAGYVVTLLMKRMNEAGFFDDVPRK